MEYVQSDLPLDDFGANLERQLEALDGRVRNCFRNAFRHLRMAWKLYGIDKEMCAFRAITAEEEAASALIWALKMRQYPGADQLRPRDHAHKMAVFCCLQAVNNFFAQANLPPIKVSVSKDGHPKVSIQIDISAENPTGELLFVTPDNPLNFLVFEEGQPSQVASTFADHLKEIFEGMSFQRLDSYLKDQANRRNLLLYADDDGIPTAEFKESFILERFQRVRLIGLVTITILQEVDNLLLVTQVLEGFLGIMPKLTATGFDFIGKLESNPIDFGVEFDFSKN